MFVFLDPFQCKFDKAKHQPCFKSECKHKTGLRPGLKLTFGIANILTGQKINIKPAYSYKNKITQQKKVVFF